MQWTEWGRCLMWIARNAEALRGILELARCLRRAWDLGESPFSFAPHPTPYPFADL